MSRFHLSVEFYNTSSNGNNCDRHMISFSCPECGKKHTARDQNAGRRGFCECGAVMLVPGTETSNQNQAPKLIGHIDLHSSERHALYLKVAGTLIGIAVVAAIACAFYFHDAWERQNRARLLSLMADANALIQAKQFEPAKAKYDELFGLLGDNVVTDKFLQEEIESARLAADANDSKVNAIVAARAETERKMKLAQGGASGGDASPTPLDRLNALEGEVNRRVASGTTDVHDLMPEAHALGDDARSRVDAMNRQPDQEGYPIEVRREAAYRTLVQQGTAPSEAREEVEAMESKGLLPDPPRKD